MSHALNIHDGLGVIARDPSAGILLAYGGTVPGAVAGYAPGCQFIKTNGTTIGGLEYVNLGTKASANFVAASLAAAISVSFIYGEATALDQPFFIADRPYTVQSINARILVAGSDASAVTGQIRKVANGTALASGTAMHSGTIDLKGTINTNQALTLAAAPATTLSAAAAIGLDVTGVTTAARGVVTMLLLPT